MCRHVGTAAGLQFPAPHSDRSAVFGDGYGTGTPSQIILSVRSMTNCRAGPGNAYDLVFSLEPGSGYLVIGKYSSGNFWIIANPAGGACWVSGKNATVAGDTSRLPVYPAPAKPTNAPSPTSTAAPAPTSGAGALPAPGALYASRVCGKGFHGKVPIWVEDVLLTWQPSVGQSGYRITSDNQPLTPVPGDATTDHIQFAYNRSDNSQAADTFGVQAFNDSGSSAVTTVSVPRCP
jgi:hypothetical protein